MTKVNKLFKTITVFVALCMLVALLPVSALAATNVVTIAAEPQQSKTDNIVVTGNIASGNELTVLAVRTDKAVANETEALGLLEGLADGKIMYIDQVTSNGADKEFSFKLRNDANAVTEGNYLVILMGGTDASAVYTVVELVSGAPESLEISGDSYTGNVEYTFTETDADANAWFEKVTVEVTKDGVAVENVTPDTTTAGSIKLNLEAGTYNITFKAEGFRDKVFENVVVADRAAGTATLSAPADGKAYYFDTETITLTLEGGHDAWADAAKAGIVVTGDNTAAYDSATGVITVDGPGNFVVEFPVLAGYGSIENLTFEVKSYGQAVIDAAIDSIKSAAAGTEDNQKDKWNITVPVAPAGVKGFEDGTFTLDWTVTSTAAIDDAAKDTGLYVVTRPVNNEDQVLDTVDVDIALTVTVDGTEYKASTVCKVNEQGADVSFPVKDIAFAQLNEETIWEDVYGTVGARVVEINAGEVDPAASVVYVDGKELFYSPARKMYVGVIVNYTDAASVLDDITVKPGESKNIYYGYASDPLHEYWVAGDTIVLADVMRALQIKNNPTLAAPTEEDYIVSDIDQDGEIALADVMAILRAKNGSLHDWMVVAE